MEHFQRANLVISDALPGFHRRSGVGLRVGASQRELRRAVPTTAKPRISAGIY
jgi:hypothetical protein